jgi:hypothetical protein
VTELLTRRPRLVLPSDWSQGGCLLAGRQVEAGIAFSEEYQPVGTRTCGSSPKGPDPPTPLCSETGIEISRR